MPGEPQPEIDELRRAFDEAHEQRYGYSDPDATLELVPAAPAQTLDDFRHVLTSQLLAREQHALDEVPPALRHDEAQRRQHTARVRHQHAPHAQLVGDLCGVQRPRTAERNKRQLAGVDPALHGDHPHGLGHLGARHPGDSGRRLVEREPELVAEPAHRSLGGAGVEPHAARERRIGVEVAQQ